MIEWLQYYNSKKPFFSRGILNDVWKHLNSDEFCLDCRNIRIKNWATTKRKWYRKIWNWLDNPWDKIINRMVVWDKIYCNIGWDFYSVDITDNEATYTLLKSNIWEDVNFVRYGRYILICNGTKDVWVYDTEYNPEEIQDEDPLPEEYIKLEYLGVKGEWPLIDLWTLSSSKPWFSGKFTWLEWDGENYFFSIYSAENSWVWISGNTHTWSLTYQYKDKKKSTIEMNYDNDTKYKVRSTENVLTITESETTTTLTTDNNANNLSGTMYVFGKNATNKSFGMKLYELKIRDDFTVKKNLIPAKRKIDGVLWLYDLVENTFYTNSGTGEFVGWPEVNYHDGERRKCTLPEWAKIRFGTVFQENIYLVWAEDKSNFLYKSRAGNRDKPWRILDFTGDWSDDIMKKSKITWVASLRWTLYIFTEDTIEALTSESMTEVGWLLTIYSTPIAGENQLATHRAIVTADDAVFFWTKWNRLKTLNYKQWFTEISVWDLTVATPIQNFLDTLDLNQDLCFGYHNKEEYNIYFCLKQNAEPFNNIVLVYDIANSNMLIDDNKFYSDVVKYNSKYYAWSGLNTEIYQDEIGNNDCGKEISRYRQSIEYYINNANYRKEFREINFVWEKDSLAEINIQISVDWKNVLNTAIEWELGYPSGYASKSTASDMTAGEGLDTWIVNFERTVSGWYLRSKWKSISFRFSGKSFGRFALSNMTIWYRSMTDQEMTDRLHPFNW